MTDPTTINQANTITLDEANGLDAESVILNTDFAQVEERIIVDPVIQEEKAPTSLTSFDKTVHFITTAYPEKTDRTRQLQLGVHFEEVCEMVEAIDSQDYNTVDCIMDAKIALKALADRLKDPKVDAKLLFNNIELLDALADQMVTSISVSLQFNFDLSGAFNEVADSNLSKFEDGKPVFTETGKIAKGRNYFKADIASFV